MGLVGVCVGGWVVGVLGGRSVGPLRNADGACIGVFVCVCKRVMDVMLVCVVVFEAFILGADVFVSLC